MIRRRYIISWASCLLLAGFFYSCSNGPDSSSPVDPDLSTLKDTQEITRTKPGLQQGFRDSLVGSLRRPPEIEFVNLQPGATDIFGTANNVDLTRHRVVLWAKTNIWYIQPTLGEPFTEIQLNGSWTNWTHPWDRMVALIVNDDYDPVAERMDHPASDVGVRGWVEYPDASIRTVDFSGYMWKVKVHEDFPHGPGPCYFSGEEDAVWVDSDGLHLQTTYRNGRWYAAEVELDGLLGYGYYTYKLSSRVDSLDYHSTFSGFVYEGNPWEEIDIEFSQALPDPENNIQYVVQPWYEPGNIVQFVMPSDETSTHRFEWREDHIEFVSWRGHSDHPSPDQIIYHWLYTGNDSPTPDDEFMRFNLWFFNGLPPVSGESDHVIVKSFEFRE